MSNPTPKNADEFIEQQLDRGAEALGKSFTSDFVSFTGPIVYGTDDIVRNVVEDIRQSAQASKALTVMLTTDGGYIEVVQRIVDTFRFHYYHVNFVVPNYAYSAGTVLAMSGDAIHMDYFSRLGPIDPQVRTASGRMVPALGYLIQWERLPAKAKAGELTMPEVQLMIEGFDQAELYQYEQSRELSVALLKEWLVKYKFKNWKETETRKVPVTDQMRAERAETIARDLNNTEKWHVHGYGISMEVLRRDLKLQIDDFGADSELKSKVRGYYNLLSDYMVKRGDRGVLHTKGSYLPFMVTATHEGGSND